MPSIEGVWATRIRPTVVAAVRTLPNVRGRGRLGLLLNQALLMAGADPRAIAKMRGGYSLIVDCRLQAHISALYTGGTNDKMIQALLGFLGPGGIALDVGANVGFVTIPLAQAARRMGARVIAVEPFPGNISTLRQTLQLNQLEDVVSILEMGLSSAGQKSELLLREDFETGAQVGNASVAETGIPEHFTRISIYLETLDAIWPTLGSPRLDVVKVDIEGHEDRFLEGGAQTLARFRPVMMMEINRWYYERRGLKFEQLIPGLLPAGYRAFSAELKPVADLSTSAVSDVLFVPEEKLPAR